MATPELPPSPDFVAAQAAKTIALQMLEERGRGAVLVGVARVDAALEHLLQALIEAADAAHAFALWAGAAFLAAGLAAALGLAAGFEAAFAFGLTEERTAGFATGLDSGSGGSDDFRLLAGLAGACSKNPANSAGSSLATSSCTCGERSGRCTVPSVPPLPALPLRSPASLSICRSADRTFC